MNKQTKELAAYVIATNREGVLNYLYRYGDVHNLVGDSASINATQIQQAVLETFITGGDTAITAFFSLHPDKEMILALFGKETEKKAKHPKQGKTAKGALLVSFSVKECLLGLVAFFLLILFLSRN